ncbi:MAG TPA: CTP synthase, partial [Myxococcota bacterium]
EEVAKRITEPKRTVVVGFIGKYVQLTEAYKSLNEALLHGGIANECKVEIRHIDSEELEKSGTASLAQYDGILVAPGFGARGTEGKIAAVRYARENKVPFFGICLGLQIAVIEYARNVAGIGAATSEEFDANAADKVIHMMEHQKSVVRKGGSMRLGSYPCALTRGSLAQRVYESDLINERHRHRFEVNNAYREKLSAAGLSFSGVSPDGELVEMIELPGHPHFIACQFHPEFLSRPWRPHPLFHSLVAAARLRVTNASGATAAG